MCTLPLPPARISWTPCCYLWALSKLRWCLSSNNTIFLFCGYAALFTGSHERCFAPSSFPVYTPPSVSARRGGAERLVGAHNWGTATLRTRDLYKAASLSRPLVLCRKIIRLNDFENFFLVQSSEILPLTLLLSKSQIIPRAKWPKFDDILLYLFCYIYFFSFGPRQRCVCLAFKSISTSKRNFTFFSLSICWVPEFVCLCQQLDLRPCFKGFKYFKGAAVQALTGYKGSGFIWGHRDSF